MITMHIYYSNVQKLFTTTSHLIKKFKHIFVLLFSMKRKAAPENNKIFFTNINKGIMKTDDLLRQIVKSKIIF